MTVNDVYTAALSILSETPGNSETTASFAPLWVNLLLSECFPAENQVRKMNNIEILEEIPTVSALTDTIPYQPVFLRPLVYGLASFLYIDDDDDHRSTLFRNRYIEAVSEAAKALVEPMRCAWEEEEDAESAV